MMADGEWVWWRATSHKKQTNLDICVSKHVCNQEIEKTTYQMRDIFSNNLSDEGFVYKNLF